MTTAPRQMPRPMPGYMGLACNECLHELVAEDWEEALFVTWEHHHDAHPALPALDFTGAYQGDVFTHHSEFKPITAEQRAALAAWDARIARIEASTAAEPLHWTRARTAAAA